MPTSYDIAHRPSKLNGRPPSERDVSRWLGLFVGDGQAFEIRAPKASVPGRKDPVNVVIRFRPGGAVEAARKALRLSGTAPGVYFVLNGIDPALPPGTVRGQGATSADVRHRRWLLIDFDPERPDKGQSATDAEKGQSLKMMMDVREHLDGRGWPAPVVADSGNGWHLLYRIDLPNDDRFEAVAGGKPLRTDGPSTLLVKSVLNALADRFDNDACGIDRKVYDAPRICKMYGTEARKGTPTEERPHRFARVLKAPAAVKTVPAGLLEALAAAGRSGKAEQLPPARGPAPRKIRNGSPGPLDVEGRASKYLANCEPAVSGQDGHGKTLKVAVEVGPGFDLPPDVAYRLLSAEYNPRCEPPWSERELRHKVDEAYRVEIRRGWHLNGDGRNGGIGTHRNGGNGDGRLSAPPGPAPPAETRGDDGDGRPVIVITTEEHAVINLAVAALGADPDIFQRGNALVTVLRDPSRAKEKIHRPVGSPRIAPLPNARLRDLMTKTAAWKQTRVDRSGGVDRINAHPPNWAVNGVAARGAWSEIRPIEAITEAPVLRPDGTILTAPGWDEATELLYEPNAEFPAIQAEPTREDARYAAERLLDLAVDFPFAGEAHRAAWLAALLTPLARFAILGYCPLFFFDANTPGSGKSKLTDIIAVIATGREMPRTAYPDSDDEMRKRITATALAGDRLMLIDNIAGTFGGSSLDSALTAPSWKDRKLGASEMTPDMPLFTIWYGTGNNVVLKGDVQRRIVPCRLESRDERPEERSEFTIKGDLLRHVRRHRPALVAAALTLLRAHALAGRPADGLTPFGSFESWSEVVRSAVFWATGLDPCAPRKELQADDPESNARTALVEAWSELPNSDRGVTVPEALRLLKDQPEKLSALHDCLMEWSYNGDLPSPRSIGKRLKQLKGRVINGKTLVSSPDRKGFQMWRVESE